MFTGFSDIRHAVKRRLIGLQNSLRPASFILMYHRITDLAIDPWKLAVSAENFDRQLAVLKRQFNILPLEEFVRYKRRHRLPNKCVAITFDDGYKDNYTTAYPILKNHQLPATFFINSGYIIGQHEFWPDRLIRLILNSYQLPEKRLDLELIGLSWDIRKKGYDQQQARFDLFWQVWYLLLQVPAIVRDQTLDQLEGWSKHDQYVQPDTYPMTETELIDMAKDPLISIGGHTRNHSALKFLEKEQQRKEILTDKVWLEQAINNPVKGFAYPNGQYDQGTIDLVKEIGFEYACTTKGMRGSSFISDYKLPRYQVFNWNESDFVSQLQQW